MKTPLKLSASFLDHAAVRVAVPEDAGQFEDLLRRAWETGCDKWPQVALSGEDFVRHLAQRLPHNFEGRPLAEVLAQLSLADLYLACACIQGMPGAIEMLEHDYLQELPKALGRLQLARAVLDEVCQTVRIQLLMGTAEGKPLLAGYKGLGNLLNWIWVIAAKLAPKHGASVREVPAERELLEALPVQGDDPELDLIKRRYGPEVRQAMREAFATLSSHQRYLLRLHYIDRLPTTRMGPLFGKDQSTISRWLKDARQQVYEETKRRLQERLHLSSREFESLLSALQSRFDVSLSQVLKEGNEDDSEEPEED